MISSMLTNSSSYNTSRNNSFVANSKELSESIQKHLNGSKAHKVEGMNIIIKIMTQGKNCSFFYFNVVRNIFCDHPDFSLLANIYISTYSSQNPKLAIMCLQMYHNHCKTLLKPWQTTLALRHYSDLDIDFSFEPIVSFVENLSICQDVGVVKAGAMALLKVSRKSPEHAKKAIEILLKMINSFSTGPEIGPPLYAFSVLSSAENLHELHKSFLKIAKNLSKIDICYLPQITLLLIKYCRTFFSEPPENAVKYWNVKENMLDLVPESHKDLFTLIDSYTKMLNTFDFPAVAAISLFLSFCAPKSALPLVFMPLMRVLSYTSEIFEQAIGYFMLALDANKKYFAKYIKNFLYSNFCPLKTKHELICQLACEESRQAIDEYLQFKIATIQSQSNAVCHIDLLMHMMNSFKNNSKYVELVFFILDSNNADLAEWVLKRIMVSLHSMCDEIRNPLIEKILAQIKDVSNMKSGMKLNLLDILVSYAEKVEQKELLNLVCLLSVNFISEKAEIKSSTLDFCVEVYRLFAESSNEFTDKVYEILEYLIKCSFADSDANIRHKARMIMAIQEDEHSFLEKYFKLFIKHKFSSNSANLSDTAASALNTSSLYYDNECPFLVPNWTSECTGSEQRHIAESATKNDKIPDANVDNVCNFKAEPKPSGLNQFMEYSD